MRTNLEKEDITAIAIAVVEMLKPILANHNKDEDELLDIEDASQLLGTSKAQIYQWVSNAKYGLRPFPFLKSGKRLRFSKTELMKWMNGR
jgi:excisionase family DNA binding protein